MSNHTKNKVIDTVNVEGIGDIKVRALSLREFRDIQSCPPEQVFARMVVYGLSDDHGNRVLANEADAEDVSTEVLLAVSGSLKRYFARFAESVAEAKKN
jgi:hypothetical protein